MAATGDRESGTERQRQAGAVVNQLSGTAGNVVQFRDLIVREVVESAPSVDPWTVAAPSPTFVDRERCLERARELAAGERSGPAVLVFCGLPGMGKSTLLRQAADSVRASFDVGLYVDFAPETVGAPRPGPGDVLGSVLCDLRADPRWLPADLAGRRRHFLTLTADRRVLVVVDNVGEAAHVLALVPNSKRALVLAASDLRLDELVLDDAELVDLEGLDGRSGAELVARTCGTGRDLGPASGVLRLVTACGGHPLSLRILAGRLSRHAHLRPAHLVTQMAGPGEGLGSLAIGGVHPVTFDAVHRDLSAPAARLLDLLGVVPGPRIEPSIAAALAGTGEDEAAPLLEELHRACLLDTEPATDTGTDADADAGGPGYVMPAVVRRYAADRARTVPEADRQEALRRAVDRWVDLAAAADAAIGPRYRVAPFAATAPGAGIGAGDGPGPGREAVARAGRWFARHHRVLLGVMRDAEALRWDDAVWRLFESLWPYYSTHKPLHAWHEAGRLAVTAARRARHRRAESRVRCLLARGYLEAGRIPDADAELAAARAIADRLDDDRLLASVLDFTGHGQAARGDVPGALASFEQALAINERLGARRGIALQAQFAGRCHGRLGHHETALALLARSRATIDPSDFRAVSRIEMSTGQVLIAVGHDREASEHLLRSLQASTVFGATALDTDTLEALADIAGRQGDVDAERTHLRAAITLHERTGGPRSGDLRRRLDRLAGAGGATPDPGGRR